MMTKKDFDGFAQIFRQVDEAIRFKWADPARRYCEWTRELMINAVADYLEEQNPRFDRDRFLAASRVEV